MEKLLVVDGNSVLYRGFYALPILSNSEGIFTNAVYGFCNIFIKALKEIKPDYVVVAFDYGKKTFRNEIFSEYKITRRETPNELVMQFPIIKQVIDSMGIKYIEMEGFEGDDILGSLAHKFDIQTIILTGDRDCLQLINPTTQVYLTKKGITDVKIYDEKELLIDKGITPKQVIDVKALMGDVADNIPGVKGIGEKGAYKLITEYGSLEGVYNNLDKLTKGLQEKLVNDKEMAYLSYTLGTIKTDCQIDYDLQDFAFSLPFPVDFYNICKKYDFSSIYKREELFAKEEKKAQTSVMELNNAKNVSDMLNKLLPYSIIAITDYNNDLYVSVYGGDTYKLNIGHKEFIDCFANIIASSKIKKLFYDVKNFKEKYFGSFEYANYEDIALMHYLLNANDKPFSEQDFLEIYSGDNLSKVLVDNFDALKNALEKNNLVSLYQDIEMPLVDVLCDMEIAGVKIDEKELNSLDEKISAEIDEVTHQIYALLGYEINLNSPKQLGEALFEDLHIFVAGNKKNSTSAEILQKIEHAHPVVPLIQKYRKLVKVKSTYIDVYKQNKKEGFIYTHFLQMVTGTGRLSCKEPNLQNIPIRDEEGKEIREVFTSRFADGYLMSLDYDQIELKLMANLSGDESMIDAFLSGQDIHSAVASKIFNVPISAVTKDMRRKAKTVNFGIIYGQSAYGLSVSLGIMVKEAQEFINAYFATFPKVKEYMQNSIQKAKDNNFTAVTMFNRMRYIPELQASNFQLKSFGERVAINMPLQGTASDIIKMAMIKVNNALKQNNLKAKLILQIHDELVFDVPSDEVEKVQALAKEAMQNVAKLKVPLTVSASVAKTLNK